MVCSAGNSGAGTWKKITPPADAENVITVGAIDRKGMNATFSSLGYTADGRVKPDVMAVGLRSSVVGTDGGVSFANGTSFASPIFCGLAACLWQACPWLSVRQLIEVIHQSGDRAQYPDKYFRLWCVGCLEGLSSGPEIERQEINSPCNSWHYRWLN